MTALRFFQGALFFPLLSLLTIAILAAWDGGLLFTPDWKAWQDFLFEIGFWYGLFPYAAFSVFMFRKIRTKTEDQIVRLMWWSPIWFIPFFGLAWFLLGLVMLMIGNLGGFGMMIIWVAFILYIPMFGYFFVGLVYGAFLFFRFMNWIKAEPQT